MVSDILLKLSHGKSLLDEQKTTLSQQKSFSPTNTAVYPPVIAERLRFNKHGNTLKTLYKICYLRQRILDNALSVLP